MLGLFDDIAVAVGVLVADALGEVDGVFMAGDVVHHRRGDLGEVASGEDSIRPGRWGWCSPFIFRFMLTTLWRLLSFTFRRGLLMMRRL